MKNFLLIITLTFLHTYCLGQETVERTRKLTPDVNEKYNVLKSDYNVLQGAYTAYLKKKLLAAGYYKNNKRIGAWTFFDSKGNVTQRYNYNVPGLTYEAPADSNSRVQYVVDDSLKNNPQFTRPVRIGGRYYGYLPYINLVKLPSELANLEYGSNIMMMELLVTPLGRLAEYKLRIRPALARTTDYDMVLNLNINLLTDEDKLFIPATLNNAPIAIRIIIPCYPYRGDRIKLTN